MGKSIIVFDGECNLCNGVIGWLIRLAPHNVFELVPFQSPKGHDILLAQGFPTEELTTVILVDELGYHTHSDGFLRIVEKIPKWRLVAHVLAYVPLIIRDTLYNLASKNRVKWFGKSKACFISF
ncbi:thiol-disulfide oxidoreductase DCC family protein [Flagellimonas marina]|jgi:predicted DCC family thiol-disulfide oxidoreductase YuxK|uniref:Thiol-disulfide oxidoreductase DCC family protein n=1 Tax=Flagellimonas marina TaxID=1775168 RepID=A0ABV8PGH7_9FLAO